MRGSSQLIQLRAKDVLVSAVETLRCVSTMCLLTCEGANKGNILLPGIRWNKKPHVVVLAAEDIFLPRDKVKGGKMKPTVL